jgi:protein-tyrosine phosphatase
MEFRMIDLHLHLLPGIDDGSQTMDETRAMLKSYSTMGFTRLIATPHLMEPLTPDYYRQALQLLVQVRPIAGEYGIQVDLGFEHLLESDTAARLTGGEPTTLASSRAVLVELPFMGWPQHTGTALFNLRSAGYRPVLAHPERYIDAQKNPDLVLDAALQGAVIQITTGSLAGLYGKEPARLAHTLLRDSIDRGLPVLFATDAHSNGNRLTSVPGGLEWVERNIPLGALVNEWASQAVPEAVLTDQIPPAFATWLAEQDPSRLAEVRQRSGNGQAPDSGARPLGKVFSRLTRSRS